MENITVHDLLAKYCPNLFTTAEQEEQLCKAFEEYRQSSATLPEGKGVETGIESLKNIEAFKRIFQEEWMDWTGTDFEQFFDKVLPRLIKNYLPNATPNPSPKEP